MSLENLSKRIQYHGGERQQNRMMADKLRGLKKALLYSYQAATAILEDDRQFRCLINPDKNKPAYDNKILSIPFRDICLNQPVIGTRTQGQVDVPIAEGDVFVWKETNTHWLVYLRYLEEDAYYRFDIRRCDQQIEIDNKSYWVYLRGPVQTSIDWSQKSKVEWNSLNYSLVMYITADETTRDYFYRFQKVKIIDPRSEDKKTWQVAGVDPYYGDGIIQVFLDEYFENTYEDIAEAEQKMMKQPNLIGGSAPYIEGPLQVKQYSKEHYIIHNATGGKWYINWKNQEHDLEFDGNDLLLDIPIRDLGIFTLIYRVDGEEDITLNVSIVKM